MTVRGACAECSRGAHCVGSAARAQGPPAAADVALLLFAAGHPGAWMYTRRSPLAWDVQSPGCSAQMSRYDVQPLVLSVVERSDRRTGHPRACTMKGLPPLADLLG